VTFSNQIIPAQERPRTGNAQYRVGLLAGCVQDLVFSEINRDSVDVLVAMVVRSTHHPLSLVVVRCMQTAANRIVRAHSRVVCSICFRRNATMQSSRMQEVADRTCDIRVSFWPFVTLFLSLLRHIVAKRPEMNHPRESEMKLRRYGAPGRKSLPFLDADRKIRNLSGIISDVAREALSPGLLDRLRRIEPSGLPAVSRTWSVM
jgi:hypothetical protein